MYHLVFASESAPPTDGDHIASSVGYHDFGTAVEQSAATYPALAHLVEHGWSEDWQALAAELPRLAAQVRAQHPDVAHVADAMLAGLRQVPEGTQAVMVSDGEPGGEWEENEGDNYG